MKSILEKALVHLLNEEAEKAQELMHQFVVERARSIHESLREDEDADTDTDDTSLEEEFFTEDDLNDTEAAGHLEDDLDDSDAAPAAEFGDDSETSDFDTGADDMSADTDADPVGGDDVDGGDDISAKIDNIEDEIKSLQAEFDKIMAEFDGGSDDDVAVADDDTVADNSADAPMMDGGEDDEFDDITESMVDDLKKITTPNTDGMGATGEKLAAAKSVSPIAKNAKNTVLASKNTVSHTGFELEKAPAKKDGPDRGRKYDNDRVKATSGNSAVPATGPKGAELAKPITGNTKSVISGSKKK